MNYENLIAPLCVPTRAAAVLCCGEGNGVGGEAREAPRVSDDHLGRRR